MAKRNDYSDQTNPGAYKVASKWQGKIIVVLMGLVMSLISLTYWDLKGDIKNVAGDLKVLDEKVDDMDKKIDKGFTVDGYIERDLAELKQRVRALEIP